MNKNKGIIGIGLILAIVLGIVIVGGGAYYLGTKNNLPKNTGGDPAKINWDNQVQENQNQNLPVDNNKPTISTTDLKTYTNTEGNKVPYDILPNEYVSLQNGSWPFIKSLPVSYSCNISNGYGDVPTVIKESIINGRKYCIESTTEGAAGSSYTTYSYKTSNNKGGSIGIKSLDFTLRSANCGVFRDNSTSGGIKYNECQKAQAEVNLKLNIIVDSIMFL